MMGMWVSELKKNFFKAVTALQKKITAKHKTLLNTDKTKACIILYLKNPESLGWEFFKAPCTKH